MTYRRASALAAALIIILLITRAPASLIAFALPPAVKLLDSVALSERRGRAR